MEDTIEDLQKSIRSYENSQLKECQLIVNTDDMSQLNKHCPDANFSIGIGRLNKCVFDLNNKYNNPEVFIQRVSDILKRRTLSDTECFRSIMNLLIVIRFLNISKDKKEEFIENIKSQKSTDYIKDLPGK